MANRQRVLYIEKPAFIGGSVTGLYELVRGLDPNRYEPIVLFGGPNPFRKHFQALGVQVETLSEAVPPLAPSTRDLAARVIKEHPTDADAQVRAAWRLTQAREPSAKELADFNRLLAAQLEHFAKLKPAKPVAETESVE